MQTITINRIFKVEVEVEKQKKMANAETPIINQGDWK